jgi:predicted kinase
MDDEVAARGLSLVDYEARFALQPQVEARIPELLATGASVIAEFGSWTRAERDRLRELAAASGSRTELHFVDAPLALCRERILKRGGVGAEDLAGAVLDSSRELYERPSDDEQRSYDAYKYIGVSAS